MIYFGIDILLKQNPLWKKERLALVTNQSATTCHYVYSRKALLDAGFNIVKLFSPEHGLDIKGTDGAKMKDGIDVLTHLPVISLYNEKLAPEESDLQDIDIVLFDIPDIGCRFYTYLWTMTHVLQTCAAYRKKCIILDRPNPLSGDLNLSEGPLLDETSCASFIGRGTLPLRHSCTLGELALYFNTIKNIRADTTVIRCEQWDRNSFQPDWGMQFIPTSPAMNNFQSALLYPGLGLLEAANISEGRGTDKPFCIIGAPWLQTGLIVNTLNNASVNAKEITFTPTESKYTHETCYSIEFQVTEPAQFHSLQNGLLLIKLIKDTHPDYFQWKPYPTNVNPSGNNHLNKLLGIPQSELLFDLPMHTFTAQIHSLTDNHQWQQLIHPYLLY